MVTFGTAIKHNFRDVLWDAENATVCQMLIKLEILGEDKKTCLTKWKIDLKMA